MLRPKPGWAPGRSPIRGRGASAALRACPIGGPHRSSRLPFPADTGPLGSASLRQNVVSCDVATLLRVVAARPVASAAHWVAGTRLGTLASGVSAMQGRCRCLQLPPRGTPRVLWGQSGRHQPTWRPHLLEWKRPLRAACATARLNATLAACTAEKPKHRVTRLKVAPLRTQNALKASWV